MSISETGESQVAPMQVKSSPLPSLIFFSDEIEDTGERNLQSSFLLVCFINGDFVLKRANSGNVFFISKGPVKGTN